MAREGMEVTPEVARLVNQILPAGISMTPTLEQQQLPTLAVLSQELEHNCKVFDLYSIGDDPQNHNFEEPCNCRCFPDVILYSSLEGRPDLVTVTHKWMQ